MTVSLLPLMMWYLPCRFWLDEKQNVPYSSYGYVNDKAVEAEKIDDLTVKLSLGSSSAGFLGGLSQVYCIPKHIYEGVENIGESDLNMSR